MGKVQEFIRKMREEEARLKAEREQYVIEFKSHYDLFDSLPASLDSFVSQHFVGRGQIPFDPTPCPLGYLSVIDGRAVSQEEHEELCKALIDKLNAIKDWCDVRTLDLKAITAGLYEEMHAIDLNDSSVRGKPLSKRVTWFFDVLFEIIRGDIDSAFNELLQMGKQVPVGNTMSLIRVRLEAALHAKHAPEVEVEKQPNNEATEAVVSDKVRQLRQRYHKLKVLCADKAEKIMEMIWSDDFDVARIAATEIVGDLERLRDCANHLADTE